ncbi:bifunctional biotin--[acetyl-CoA-carboxylase] ligase/biotin operon repressor BirA [Celerinatantimonas sp. YJH-8]|uniref:bifunctional biotin--[acetyl-CoA-carboxylase] ligase/biotin operon repressor BirA n=1 Tax=Celerinatantimonas sp. YJH-8 TaxID=3228714 RepID=UPI0038CBFEF0
MLNHAKAFQLLHYLSDSHFHSGQRLADILNVSRTSIASYVHQLIDMGVDIYSVKGRGYRLAAAISLLDEQWLREKLQIPVYIFPEMASTNTWVMEHLGELSHGQLVSCDYQSAGRGRRGRGFQSAVAGQLPFSIYWCYEGGLDAIQGLSLVVGVAIAETLRQQGYRNVGLKWPNDIYAGHRKLAGILIEMNGQPHQQLHLVAGIGINIRLGKILDSIDQPVTDLEHLQEHSVDRNQLLVDCYRALEQAYQQFCQQGLSGFIERWNSLDIFHGEMVKLVFSNGHIESGAVKGVDEQGNLLLEQLGIIQSFAAGEVSLRPQ